MILFLLLLEYQLFDFKFSDSSSKKKNLTQKKKKTLHKKVYVFLCKAITDYTHKKKNVFVSTFFFVAILPLTKKNSMIASTL